MVKLLPILLLAGCNNLYYPEPIEGMVITEHHYTDAQELAMVCGDALACAFTNGTTFCEIHLPLAANGDVMHRDHELTHCYGRVDAPQGFSG